MAEVATDPFVLNDSELASVSHKEVLESHCDVLGITLGDAGNTLTAAATSAAAAALDAELGAIPAEEKSAFLEARVRCPNLVDDSQRKRFLARENLDAKLAARRLVRYWGKRREVFGPVKCFLPLTLSGALQDDKAALSCGFIHLLPGKDEVGRAIVFYDFERYDLLECSRESMLRAMWYIYHIASQDPNVFEKGIVSIQRTQHARIEQMDTALFVGGMDMLKVAPFRFRACHICHPNSLIRYFVGIAPLLGAFYKMRFRVHSGSEEKVLRELENYRIPRNQVPRILGGRVEIDLNNWLRSRALYEASFLSSGQTAPFIPFQIGATSVFALHPVIPALEATSWHRSLFGSVPVIQHGASTGRILEYAHVQPSVQMEQGASVNSPRLLYCQEDKFRLSELLCLVRSQIEVFAASQEDVDVRGQRGGRTCRITLGRVGLRCSHCAHLPYSERAKGAATFPDSIKTVYQSVRNFKRDHLPVCQCIPEDTREKAKKLKEERKNSSGVKEYFAESCERLGMVDMPDGGGIIFKF